MGSIVNPTDLSGLTIWFDADSPTATDITVNSSGKVTQWTSRQPASGTKPTLTLMKNTDIELPSATVNTLTTQTRNGYFSSVYGSTTSNSIDVYSIASSTTVNSKVNNNILTSTSVFNDNITTNTLNTKKILDFSNGVLKYSNVRTFFNKPLTTTFTYSASFLLKKNSTNRAYPFTVFNNNNTARYINNNNSASFFGNNNNNLTISRNGTSTSVNTFQNYLDSNNWFIYTVVFDNIKGAFSTQQKRKYYLNGISIGSYDTITTEPFDFLINSTNGNAFIGNVSTSVVQNRIETPANIEYYTDRNRTQRNSYATVINITNTNTYNYTLNGFNGSIAEIIFYNEYKTADDLRKVNDYLLDKWGSTIISALPTPPQAISQIVFLDNKTLAQNIEDSIEPLFLTNNIQIFDGATQINDIANITNKTYNVRYEITSAVSGNFDVPIKKVKATVGEAYVFSAGETTTQLSHTNSDGSATSLNYKWYFDASSTLVGTVANPSLALPNKLITPVTASVSFTDTNYGTFSYDLTPTQVVRLDEVFLATQYLQAEGQSLTIPTDPSLATVVGATYQWFKGTTPIVGATGLSYTFSSLSASDSADYKLQITYNGVTYDSSTTRVDVIVGPVENLQLSIGESGTLSIVDIPGATYSWRRVTELEETESGSLGTSSTFPISISIDNAATNYALYRVKVTKNGVSADSRNCVVSYYTPLIVSNFKSETLSMPNPTNNTNPPSYKFLETTPDGRMLFVDNVASNLFVTEPGYMNRTSFDKNITLYRIPAPSIDTSTYNASTTLMPRVTAYYGPAGSSSSGSKCIFTEGTHAYAENGKYMALICVGTVEYKDDAVTPVKQSVTNAQFVQIYKLEGTTITPCQQLIIGVMNTGVTSNKHRYNKNTMPTTSESSSKVPMYIDMASNGTYLGVVLGSVSDTGGTTDTGFTRTFHLYKKNTDDTWGTVRNPSTASNSYRTVEPTKIYNVDPYDNKDVNKTMYLHGIAINSDATLISVSSSSRRFVVSPYRNSIIYRYNSTNDTYVVNTTLQNNIDAELRKLIPQNSSSIDQPDQQAFLYNVSDDGNTLIGVSYVDDTKFYTTKRYIVFLSYNSTNNTVGLKYYYKVPSLAYDVQYTPDGKYMLATCNFVADGTNKYIYKIPNYYINKIQGAAATENATIDTSTAGFYDNVYIAEKSGFKVKSSYNAWLSGDKLVLFQPDKTTNQKLIIGTFTDELSRVKPVLTNTSTILLKEVNERRQSAAINIKEIMDTIVGSTYNINEEGILLRVKNITATIDGKTGPVGDWRFYAEGRLYNAAPSSSTKSQRFSTTYSSSGTDKWYLFRNSFDLSNSAVTSNASSKFTHILIDLSSNVPFNNDKFPDVDITLEYKTWSGFGVEFSSRTMNRTITINNTKYNYNAFLTDGTIVTINDLANTPFSNATGTLKVSVKNVIDAPDYIGKELTPISPQVSVDTAGTSTTPTKYKFTINTLANTINPIVFSINDIINAFRITMKGDYDIPNPVPSYYTSEHYKGGICIFNATNDLLLQVSIDGGQKWYFLKGTTTGLYYFFNPQVRNYLFRFAKFSATVVKSIFVIPWNGLNLPSTADTKTNIITEFSSLPNIANNSNEFLVDVSGISKIDESTYIETSKYVLPSVDKYLIGPSGKNGSYIEPTLKTNTAPILKSAGPFTLKTLDSDNNVIDYKVRDADSGKDILPWFSPADLFYGVFRNGSRVSSSRSIIADTSNTPSCDVYTPDISGNQRILGIAIDRTNVDLSNSDGRWQYSINSGTTWNNMYNSTANTKLRLWWYDLNDTRLRIRFNPASILDKSKYIDLSFQVYDGADFVPYAQGTATNTNYRKFLDPAYDINGTSFAISTNATISTLSTTGAKLRIYAEHVNSAPILTQGYSITTPTTYRYNSANDISFNTITLRSQQIESYSYSAITPIVNRNIQINRTSINAPNAIFKRTNTLETVKNKFRINVADILKKTGLSDNDPADSIGIALYSSDASSAIIRYVDNIGNKTTITNISESNAFHIPSSIIKVPLTFTDISAGNPNLILWMHLADPLLTDTSTRARLFLKNTNQLKYILNNKFSSTSWQNKSLNIDNNLLPIVVPNVVNGNPVLRFVRNNNNYLQLATAKGTTDDAYIFLRDNFISSSTSNLRNMIIIERKASNSNGKNPLFSDGPSYNRIYFGYTKDDEVSLEYIEPNTQLTSISYSDPALAEVGVVRMWHIKYELISGKQFISIFLNNILCIRKESNIPIVSVFSDGYYLGVVPKINTYENIYYDGDICDFMVYNSNNPTTTANAAFIKNVEDYLAYTWLNPSLEIETIKNQTIDLSYNFYAWDGTNSSSLVNNYGPITARGGTNPYSVNSGTFTIKLQKANSRPVLSMNASTTDNAAILPSFSNATKLAFKLNDLDIATQVHEFTIKYIFDNIIRTRYTDEDLTGTPPDIRGLAITSIDNTLGTWSVVKTDGTVENLTGISTTNAYLIKCDDNGANKLRLTLNSTGSLATNRFHTDISAGLPGTTFFQAIGWDSTRSTQTEYNRVNLIDASANNAADVENPFSILNNGVFEFRTSTLPYINGVLATQEINVFNDLQPSKNEFIPNSYLSSFKTSQTNGTKRIDINSINGLKYTDTNNVLQTVVFQYKINNTWTDISSTSFPINGTYPIRVNPDEPNALLAVDRIFTFNMELVDTQTTLRSPSTGSLPIRVTESNLIPTIGVNENVQSILRTNLASLNATSKTITYNTIFNDIGEFGLPGEPVPEFLFSDYTSFKTPYNKPISWMDQNKSSTLKRNYFAIEIKEARNGNFQYKDTADTTSSYVNIPLNNTYDRFLISSSYSIRYIPKDKNEGEAIIRIYAWDGATSSPTGGTAAGTLTNDVYTYTVGAFSNDYVTLKFPVIPRNTAPTLPSNNPIYPAIVTQTDTNEDISGTSIYSIINNTLGLHYYDKESINDKGLVIVDVSGAGLGTWQTSINGGTTWTSTQVNLHLLAGANADAGSSNRIRFRFDPTRTTFPQSYSEIPFVRVAAWDKTNSVANGEIAVIDTSGGATAYSSETIRLGAAISHRNHAPTLTAGTSLFSLGSVNANASIDISYQTIFTAIGTGVLGDPDIGDTIGIKITDISFNNTPSAGISMGTWSYTDSVLNGQYIAIGSAGAELMPNRNPVLRFQADKYVYGTTTLSFRAFDGELTSSNTRTLSLTVNDINYAPTFTNTQDISYNVVFDVSRTILVSSITSALNPSDRNTGTNYGIVLSASSFDSTIALIEYSLNPNGTTPIYNTITNSQFGSSQTAIHLPSNAAIRYIPRLNQPFSNSLDILLWDRSNNSAVVSEAGNAIAVPIIRDEFSPYSADSVKLIFNHQQVNFAPTITNNSSTLQTIVALETTNTFPVSTLLTTIGWADRNSGDRAGLVIVGVDICGGLYEYTIDDGANWTPLPTNLSTTSGLHFDNVSASAIRYRSTRNTTDFSTFTVVGWDQTTTVAYGTVAAIPSTRGGNTSYSSNTHTFRVEQTHVNSRPVMTAGNNTTTTAVNYNPTDYTWFQFSDYIPVSSTFTDPDYALVRRGGVPQVADKTFGILITSVDTSGGSWLISSDRRTVTNVNNASESAAIIASPTDSFALRTSKNNPLTFKLTYKAWDKSSRTTTTTVDTTDSNNTSYSENSGTINIPVLHVNTPPTINSDISGFQASSIVGDGDDNPNPTGFTVASIIDDLVARGVYVDPDTRDWGYTAEPTGLIIVGSTLTNTTGTWSYSTNGGSSWTSILTSGSSRLHLTYSANNIIRYRPSNNANGLAVLRVAAWDQSNGVANGTTANVTSSQRTDALTQAYSVNETTIRVPTVYLNHAPQFTTLTYTMPEVQFGNVNAGRAWTNIFTSLGYTDKDTQDPQGLVVDSITIPPGLTGVFQVQSGTTWTNVTTGLQFTLPTYSSIRFAPAANITDDELIASITIRPFDGQFIGSTTATLNVPVIKALFSPTISATLPSSAVVNFRADNRLTPFGGVSQGVTITKLLNDMGFTDTNVGEARGMAIQSVATRGTTGFFEVKLGNGPWLRLPTIPRNNYYLLAEFTGSVVNRIRFNSTTRNQTGTASITFFGWDLSDVGPGTQSGSLKQYTQQPVSFSARNGTYRMNIQRIVGR